MSRCPGKREKGKSGEEMRHLLRRILLLLRLANCQYHSDYLARSKATVQNTSRNAQNEIRKRFQRLQLEKKRQVKVSLIPLELSSLGKSGIIINSVVHLEICKGTEVFLDYEITAL